MRSPDAAFPVSVDLWPVLRKEAQQVSDLEPVLASYIHNVILHHATLADAMSFLLANMLESHAASALLLREVCLEAMHDHPLMVEQLCRDAVAHYERDAACDHYLMPVLYFKGFHALQAYRVAHWLWLQGRRILALHFQSRISEVFAVDIHPAATIGSGIMLDHATGIVIGATSVIEDGVSLLHGVTLGGSGRHTGQRHPRIRRGAVLAAGAKVLGAVDVGKNTTIGAGTLVLTDVPEHSTAIGVPARLKTEKHKTSDL